MQNFTYETVGVCSQAISFCIDEGKIYDIRFFGGCPGNLSAISKLLEGTDAKAASEKLRGNDCGGKGTSCADQLARAIDQALARIATAG